MRAIIAQEKRPVFVDLPTPTPAPDELLVRVRATALNRADLLQVAGRYPPPPDAPDTLGLEMMGEVAAFGADVTGYQAGERVMGILGGGGYAEYARLPAAHAMRVPSNLDDAQAAALPEAFLTAYSNLLEIGGLLSRQTALIHAGASGVGLAAIQIAKQIGAKTVVTASAGKHEVCLAHGADRVLDYRAVNFAEVILQDSDGVDVVLDFLGASTFADNLRVLKPWGKLVIVGLMGGADVQADLSLLMRKNLTLAGSTLRGRTAAQKAGLTQRFWHWAEPLFLTGALRPTVWRVLDWTEVETAHRLMAENQNAGKIVLKIGA